MPDHSADVMTVRGWTWVSWKVIRSPPRGSARSDSWRPVRSSIERKPSTARRPLVVPESARITSHASWALLMEGRPSAAPPRTSPCLAARYSTSSSGFQLAALVELPRVSRSGPRAVILSATAP